MFITKCGDCHCWRYLGEIPGQKGLTYGHCKLFPDRDGKLERKDDDYCGIIAYLEAMKTLLDQIKVNTARMLIDEKKDISEKEVDAPVRRRRGRPRNKKVEGEK